MTTAHLVDGVRPPIVLRALVERLPSVDWSALEDVVLGCADQAGEDDRDVARTALLAGLPVEAPRATLDRLCGSGLDAIADELGVSREDQDASPTGRRPCSCSACGGTGVVEELVGDA